MLEEAGVHQWSNDSSQRRLAKHAIISPLRIHDRLADCKLLMERNFGRSQNSCFALGIVALFSILLLLGVFLVLQKDIFPSSEVVHGTLIVNGDEREYRLVMPLSLANKNESRQVPLVLALHGALDTVDEMAKYTGLDTMATKHGFILIYLQGRKLNWPPYIPPENPDLAVPDFHFFDAVCEFANRKYNADLARVYVVGVSQGGCMCNLLVANRSKKIAAAVDCCGWMPKPLDTVPLQTDRKTPILFIVGANDTQVPPSVVLEAHDTFKKAGHPVEFRLVPGMGHGWPKAKTETTAIWDFLSKHQIPEETDPSNGTP